MKLSFIGSGVEREDTRLDGIEIHAIARIMAERYGTLVFGGSKVGLMEAFASAFTSFGGDIVSVVPRWLEHENLVFEGPEPIWCDDLAERKRHIFAEVDAVLCYPGGLGTWDELFDLLAKSAVMEDLSCPPIYLYNWEKFYSPLLLQIETAVAVGLIRPERVAALLPFESVEELSRLLPPRT
jgi:uncharacterized protein (TIGR00730 family)